MNPMAAKEGDEAMAFTYLLRSCETGGTCASGGVNAP